MCPSTPPHNEKERQDSMAAQFADTSEIGAKNNSSGTVILLTALSNCSHGIRLRTLLNHHNRNRLFPFMHLRIISNCYSLMSSVAMADSGARNEPISQSASHFRNCSIPKILIRLFSKDLFLPDPCQPCSSPKRQE